MYECSFYFWCLDRSYFNINFFHFHIVGEWWFQFFGEYSNIQCHSEHSCTHNSLYRHSSSIKVNIVMFDWQVSLRCAWFLVVYWILLTPKMCVYSMYKYVCISIFELISSYILWLNITLKKLEACPSQQMLAIVVSVVSILLLFHCCFLQIVIICCFFPVDILRFNYNWFPAIS